MKDKIEQELLASSNILYTSSSLATYDKYPYDQQYTYMYTDYHTGAHRDLNPLRMGDWGTNAIINCYKAYLNKYVKDDAKILDFGTGVGWPAYWIEERKYSIIGVDASLKMIELAELAKGKFKNSRVEFLCANGDNLPFEDNTFDAVIMDRVLEFTQNPEIVMKELSRVLKQGGVLLAGITNWQKAFGRLWGGFIDGKRVLYPKRESKIIRMPNNQIIFKYRCCSLEPPEERSYYISFKRTDRLEGLVKIINNDYVDAALIAIKKFQIQKVEIAICKQYTPEKLLEFFCGTNFEIENIHGIRSAINNSATYFIKNVASKTELDRQLFDLIIKGLVKVIQFSDYRKDIDMYTIAINRKD